MKIFSDKFIGFLKQTLICSWKGHRKEGWVEVYWAPAHSAGYQSRFCKVCHKELETTRGKSARIINKGNDLFKLSSLKIKGGPKDLSSKMKYA